MKGLKTWKKGLYPWIQNVNNIFISYYTAWLKIHSRSVVTEVDSGTNASLDCKLIFLRICGG